ncbi:TPA: hypothetical protein ACH3X1_014397 [Trebouxia sp. C0004]
MQVEISGSVRKQRLPVLLGKWYQWGQQQPDLFQQARQLCSGPLKSAQVFDRATIQGIRFSTTKTEGKKKARESVVLMSDDDKFKSQICQWPLLAGSRKCLTAGGGPARLSFKNVISVHTDAMPTESDRQS